MACAKDADFHTAGGYKSIHQNSVTESMEDYLEMICRLAEEDGFVRVNLLSSMLNVKPSSSSKMVALLKEQGLVEYEKYGVIKPSEAGWELGRYLLYRHEVLHRFFCLLNRSGSELEQVEQIEHFMTRETVENLDRLYHFLLCHPPDNDHEESPASTPD